MLAAAMGTGHPYDRTLVYARSSFAMVRMLLRHYDRFVELRTWRLFANAVGSEQCATCSPRSAWRGQRKIFNAAAGGEIGRRSGSGSVRIR